MDAENNLFEFIDNKEEPKVSTEDKIETKIKDNDNSFVAGLPDWDLEPPYEFIRRND